MIDFDNLELRSATGTATHVDGGEPPSLSHRTRGQVSSRQKLLEDVWGVREDTDTRAIDNFVVRLRRYIEDDPARPRHLLTVRGVGYRFVVVLPIERSASGSIIPKCGRRSAEHARYCVTDAAPGEHLAIQLPASRASHFVVLRASVVFRIAPVGHNPSTAFHTMERGIERTFFHPDHVTR